eukprot:GHVP01061465.1.p1 GENE.GHVP01061465.1~~GHVP01061465.1.p1  ORF type:complete len:108 (-),score=19.05 GHVP01061465.1:331-654(-)
MDLLCVFCCEKQRREMKKTEEPKTERRNAYYYELKALWFKYNKNDRYFTLQKCKDFLFRMMYKENEIEIINDDREIVQTARHLRRFLEKEVNCCIPDDFDSNKYNYE